GSPSTNTLMWRRSRGPASTNRSRMPGTDRSSSVSTSPTVPPATSCLRAVPGNRATSDPRSITVAIGAALDDVRLDSPARRQRVGHQPPRVAPVRAEPQLAGGRPEAHPDRVERVAGHRLAPHGEVGILLRQAGVRTGPRRATVVRAPDGRVRLGHE